MSATKFKDRIRIEALTAAAADDPEYGPQPGGWTPIADGEVWAEVWDTLPSRSESTADGIRLAADTVRVRIRYRADVTAAMRFVELTGMQRTLQIIAGPAALYGRRELEFIVERFSS